MEEKNISTYDLRNNEDGVLLEDLTGDHALDGVDIGLGSIASGWLEEDEREECNIISFRLDGTIYTAIEDPNDGYRSMLRTLVKEEPGKLIKNSFEPVHVFASVVGTTETDEDGGKESLMLTDKETGKLVLEVGTDNVNDYYPYFIGFFNPRAMIINQ